MPLFEIFSRKKIILKTRVKRSFFKWSLKVDGLAITERFSAIHTEERKLTLVQTNRRKVKKTWHEHDQRKMIPLFFFGFPLHVVIQMKANNSFL